MKKVFFIVTILFLLSSTYARSETEKYSCIEVKTDLAGDEIQYSVNKENHAEFTLRDCLPENLNIQVKNRNITYKKSRRLVEDGRIEKNDLFAIECSEPFPEDGDMTIYKWLNINFHRGNISSLITPEYPLYPTLKQTAEKLNLEIPHRTFIVFSGFGGSTYEFFCYLDKKHSQDRCAYTFDEVIDIHLKNKDAVSLGRLGEKYLKRFEYDKAEKAYTTAMKIDSDYQPLLLFYTATKQYNLKSPIFNNYDKNFLKRLDKIYF